MVKDVVQSSEGENNAENERIAKAVVIGVILSTITE